MGQIRKIESLRSLADLFSVRFVSTAISDHSSDLIDKRIRKHLINIQVANGYRYADFFGSLYKELCQLYANEYIFKNTILNTVRKNKKYNESVVLDELTIGKSIADMVIINGEAEIYEIKTLLDKPDKLHQQLQSYYKAVKLVNVVIHKSELEKYMLHLKAEPCGILVYSVDHGLKRIRKPEPCSVHLDSTTIFKLLRKNEYLAIVNKFVNLPPNLPNTEMFRYCLTQVKQIEILEFQESAFQIMKLRKRNLEGFFATFCIPDEFAYVSYQINLKSYAYSEFSQFLDKTLN